jgi:hypothetical protein
MGKRQSPDEESSAERTGVDVMCLLGKTVLMCHVAENHLKRCLIYVLPSQKGRRCATRLWFLEDTMRRKTIGQLVGELRKRADVQEDLLERLLRFTAVRNQLIHGLVWDFRFSIETAAERRDTYARLQDAYVLARDVVNRLAAAIKPWAVETLGRAEVAEGAFAMIPSDQEETQMRERDGIAVKDLHGAKKRLEKALRRQKSRSRV